MKFCLWRKIGDICSFYLSAQVFSKILLTFIFLINSCKVQFASAEEAELAVERLKGKIGQNLLKQVDVPYVVQSAKLAVASIQQDQ